MSKFKKDLMLGVAIGVGVYWLVFGPQIGGEKLYG